MRWPWQRKQASGLPSTETNTESSTTAPLPRREASSLSNTLHHSCSTLPLSLFIEIILEGDLRWLIISGNPSQEQLDSAWQNIVEEYTSLIKTEKSDSIFELFKKIKIAEWQLSFIEKSVLALKFQYDEDIASWLGDQGFGQVEKSSDREIYLKSLYRIETGARMLIVMLNQYHAEYKLLNEKSDQDIDEPANKRARYEKEIAMLSRFQGYRIIKEKITVLEYCAIINNYLEECRQSKKEAKDGR